MALSGLSSVQGGDISRTDAYHLLEAQRLLAQIEAMAEATGTSVDDLIARAINEVQERATTIWTAGVEPVTFEEFSMLLDGKRLSERQAAVFNGAGMGTASSIISPTRQVQEIICLWGKGCLAAESEIAHLGSGEIKTVKEWAEIGCPMRVATMLPGGKDGIADASPIYLKGQATIYRVKLADGRTFRATGHHKCLGTDGWQAVDTLSALSSAIQCDEGYIPVIAIDKEGVEDFYDLTVPGTHCYYDAQGILHHNSGKDWIISRLFAYFSFILLSMKSPAPYFNPLFVEGERIDVINVAPRGGLAEEVFFEYLARCIRKPIFEPFVLNDRQQILNTQVTFPQINLNLRALNSSARGVDGYNPLMWCMDEADAFLDGKEKSNAEGMHKILRSSASTRWISRWIGAVITYTREMDGFAIRTYNQSLGDPNFYCDRAATWEVRPDISRDDPNIAADYKNDPTGAAAMYQCLPPPVFGGFFEYHEFIENSVGHRSQIAIIKADGITTRSLENGEVAEYLKATVEHCQRGNPQRAYFLAGDGGEIGDAFAVSVWSVVKGGLRGSGGQVAYICPQCLMMDEDGGLRTDGVYDNLTPTELQAWQDRGETCVCSVCYSEPSTVGWKNWMRRKPIEEVEAEEGRTKTITARGTTLTLPAVREELIFRVVPQKATRQGDKSRLVDFVAMQDVVQKLIQTLPVQSTRMDKWQTVQMVQALRDNCPGMDIDKISMAHGDQYLRAILVKMLLYHGLIEFLECPERDLEWSRLIRRGTRIDHPPNGSKDFWDAESCAIFTAVQYSLGGIDLSWLADDLSPTMPISAP